MIIYFRTFYSDRQRQSDGATGQHVEQSVFTTEPVVQNHYTADPVEMR